MESVDPTFGTSELNLPKIPRLNNGYRDSDVKIKDTESYD